MKLKNSFLVFLIIFNCISLFIYGHDEDGFAICGDDASSLEKVTVVLTQKGLERHRFEIRIGLIGNLKDEKLQQALSSCKEENILYISYERWLEYFLCFLKAVGDGDKIGQGLLEENVIRWFEELNTFELKKIVDFCGSLVDDFGKFVKDNERLREYLEEKFSESVVAMSRVRYENGDYYDYYNPAAVQKNLQAMIKAATTLSEDYEVKEIIRAGRGKIQARIREEADSIIERKVESLRTVRGVILGIVLLACIAEGFAIFAGVKNKSGDVTIVWSTAIFTFMIIEFLGVYIGHFYSENPSGDLEQFREVSRFLDNLLAKIPSDACVIELGKEE